MRHFARSMLLLVLGAVLFAAEPPKQPSAKDTARALRKEKAPEPKEPKARALPEPDYLPQLAREYLRRRMERHARDMQALISAVVLLDKDLARELATAIATEPRLARPEVAGDEDDTLNKALPLRFFTLQDELRLQAQKVADAAKTDDDKALATAFGRLAETCVSCHSAYLKPEPR